MSRPKKIVFIVVCVFISTVLLICPVMAESASQFDYTHHNLRCKSFLYPDSAYETLSVGSVVFDPYDGNNNAVYNFDVLINDTADYLFGGEPSEKFIVNLSFDSVSYINSVEVKNFNTYDGVNGQYSEYPSISVSFTGTAQSDDTWKSTNTLEIIVDLSNLKYPTFNSFSFELWLYVPDSMDSWYLQDSEYKYIIQHNSFACRTITESEYKSDPDYQMNLEKTEATNSGNSSVDSLTGAIPDMTSGFLDSFSNLATAMSTKSTSANWFVPKIKLPAISGVMPEITLTSRQEIDFEYWVNKIPSNVLSVVRIICTCSLIIFCVKEVYGLIQSVMVNKGGDE